MGPGGAAYPAAAAVKPRRIKGPLAVMLVGAAMIVPAVASLLPGFVRSVTSPTIRVPGTAVRHLTPGRYAVYERSGTKSSTGNVSVSTDRGTTIAPEQVSVRGSDGSTIRVGWFATGNVNETITRNTDVYTAVVAFRAERPDDYRLTFSTEPGDVIVGRTLGDQFGRSLPLLGLAAAGTIAFVVGLVLLIVLGIARPSPSTTPTNSPAGPGGWPAQGGWPTQAGWPATGVPATGPPPMTAPSGWYPDPQVPGRHRYWDGVAWTDHRS